MVTFAILFITMLFAATKLSNLLLRNNPEVNIYVEKDVFSNENRFEAKEHNFMMAFALSDYVTKELKNDNRYIKWFARYIEVIDD